MSRKPEIIGQLSRNGQPLPGEPWPEMITIKTLEPPRHLQEDIIDESGNRDDTPVEISAGDDSTTNEKAPTNYRRVSLKKGLAGATLAAVSYFVGFGGGDSKETPQPPAQIYEQPPRGDESYHIPKNPDPLKPPSEYFIPAPPPFGEAEPFPPMDSPRELNGPSDPLTDILLPELEPNPEPPIPPHDYLPPHPDDPGAPLS